MGPFLLLYVGVTYGRPEWVRGGVTHPNHPLCSPGSPVIYLFIYLFVCLPMKARPCGQESSNWDHSYNGDLQLETEVMTWRVFRLPNPGG